MPQINADPIVLSPTVHGGVGFATITASTISLTLEIIGYYADSTIVSDATIDLSLNLELSAEVVVDKPRYNWVGWSKIGEASFILDITNDAGYRPMEWAGYIFSVKKLGDKVIVYGTNGITMMNAVSNPYATFGFTEVSRTGLKSKNSVCGTEEIHYFIDRQNRLHKLSTERLEILDYAEYLSTLTNPSMFFDQYLKRVLISDVLKGFIYTESGLGGGYGNLSGFAYLDGVPYGSSPTEILHPAMEFATDILDFGRRSQKTVESVQVGTDTPESLELSYDYRYDTKAPFAQTHWIPLNYEGIAYLKCTAMEFRIRIRALGFAEIGIDYLNVQFKTPDQRFSRSALASDIQQSAFAGRT